MEHPFRICAIGTCVTAIVLLRASPFVSPATVQGTSTVKLIEYGWDSPRADFVRIHIREMERRPFDGVIMRLDEGGGDVFRPQAWDEEKLAPQLPVLRDIQWQSFDSNFLAMYAASSMDWYDDTDWRAVTAHAAFMGRAARACRCAGLVFDPEPYGPSPWTYAAQVHAADRTFAEYQAVVRRRGREFMRALQQEYPGLELLTLHGYSYFPQSSSGGCVGQSETPLMSHPWGLLPAFFDGLLEEADSRTRIIDGTERSYFFERPDDFLRGAATVKRGALPFVATELREKYRRQVQVAQAVFLDWIVGTYVSSRPSLVNGLRGDQRARLVEHHTYHALRNVDRYVWVYSEKMNWWTGEGLPPGAENAVDQPDARRRMTNPSDSIWTRSSASRRSSDSTGYMMRCKEDGGRCIPPFGRPLA